MSREDIATLARTQVAISAVHDSVNAKLSRPGNKKAKNQKELQDSLQSLVADILRHSGLSDAEYQRRTYIVSTDSALRRVFDSVVVVVTGAPLPGQLARGPQLPVPPGPAGIPLGHIVNGFTDTPNLQGLLPTALAEARIAAQITREERLKLADFVIDNSGSPEDLALAVDECWKWVMSLQ